MGHEFQNIARTKGKAVPNASLGPKRSRYVSTKAIKMSAVAIVTSFLICTASGAQDILSGQGSIPVTFFARKKAVLSAMVTSPVVKIYKEFEGEAFEKDELLMELDSEVFKDQLDKATVMMEFAETNLAGATQAYNEKRSLKQSEADYEFATLKMKAAEKSRENQTHITVAKAKVDAATKAFDVARQTSVSKMELAAVQSEYIMALAGLEMAEARQKSEYAEANKYFIEAKTSLMLTPYRMESDLKMVKKELAEAKSSLTRARAAYDSCFVRAPFKGRIHRIYVQEHEMVKDGVPLVELMNDEQLLAKFMVQSKYITLLRIGQKVSIKVDETKETVVGEIVSFDAAIHASSHTFYVHALVENSDQHLRVGMRGMIERSEICGE